MGNAESKNQNKTFMEQRERSNTEHRKQGTLAMNLVREEFNRDIQEVYDLRSGELLGKGGFGTVRVVTHKATQIKYALKTIELKDVETHEQYEFLLNEIEIMKKLDHPNIARVQEVFHTPDHYYMVMDLYTGGDMYARYKFRSEDDTAKIVNKLINALRYCHDRNVGHRDIKLENICFESMADDAEVKLVDFGLSISFKDEQIRHDLVGSWAFMAPEVLQRAHHPQACDLWSMGVVTYCLLVGFPPFRAVNLKQLKDQILFGTVTFEEDPWRNVSGLAKDFILKLLRKDPSKRLTAQQAQQHPWLSCRPRSKSGESTLSPKVVENLRQFKNLNLMKRVALGVVARTLEPSEMRNLEQEFHKADRTKSGVISIEDFREILLQSKQFPKKEVDEIFEGVDIGSSGLLSYTDFTAAALDRQTLDTKRLRYAFERLDHDNNGELDYEDLMMTVGSDLTSEDVRTALKQFDPSGNGKVTFDDFCKAMRSAGSLDALATAQLTSGDMVERIAKGEGKEAIQQTLTEIERKTPTDALEMSLSPLQAAMRMPLKDCAAPAEAGAQVPGRDSGAVTHPMDIVGWNRPKSLESSGRYSRAKVAAMIRPQSYEHGVGLLRLLEANAAAEGKGRSVDSAGAGAGGGTATVTIGGGATPGESASVGGGVEATAPSPRKWSKEASPVGGGRADASVSPGGWAGEKGGGEPLPVVKMDLGGEVFRESLADRRMRDSIRLRGIGAGGVGAAGGLGFSPRIVAPSSVNFVAPGPSPASPLPTVSPVEEVLTSLASSASSSLPLQPQKATETVEATGAKAGGALGAAAASGKSGGEPAERHGILMPRKKIAPEDDLPPRDSTAGEVDLGWGSEGPPPDLVGPPPSSDGSNSSCGSNNVSQRSSKALRFGGVSGNERKGVKRRDHRGNGVRQTGHDVFDGRFKGGGGGGIVADVPENGVCQGGDSMCMDDDDDFCGGRQDRRRTSRGMLCVPPSVCGGEMPSWMKWAEGFFRANPDQL